MEKFTIELNILDQTILKDLAKELGFPNDRALINYLVENFPKHYIEQIGKCDQKKKKSKNIYSVPNHHIEFYSNLACRHSTTLSGVIFKLVILPAIAKKIIAEH